MWWCMVWCGSGGGDVAALKGVVVKKDVMV